MEMEVKDIKLNTEGTVTNTRNMHCCLMKDQHFYSFLICVTSMLYYLAVGITAVVGSMLINQKIAGNYDHPNSQSVFTDVTSSFLFSAASVLTIKYESALSDYMGRKPLIILACIFSILAKLIYSRAENSTMFYVGAFVGGCGDCYYSVSQAWLCDIVVDPVKRGKTIGYFTGIMIGIAFSVGVPLGVGLAVFVGFRVPYYLSILLILTSMILVFISPVDDTLGIKEDTDQWGGLTSAAAIVYLGIAIAIISPALLSKYDSLALVTYCSFVFGLGISIFSIAGTGIRWGKFLVYPGLLFIPVGMAWIGALETIITTKYGADKQGEVIGMMNQLKTLSIVISYSISILFSQSLKGTWPFYFPGCGLAVAAVFCFFSTIVHINSHGYESLILRPRKNIHTSTSSNDINNL